jgi:hypothetical protein
VPVHFRANELVVVDADHHGIWIRSPGDSCTPQISSSSELDCRSLPTRNKAYFRPRSLCYATCPNHQHSSVQEPSVSLACQTAAFRLGNVCNTFKSWAAWRMEVPTMPRPPVSVVDCCGGNAYPCCNCPNQPNLKLHATFSPPNLPPTISRLNNCKLSSSIVVENDYPISLGMPSER